MTGANIGLGLEAARHFVRLGASKVILGCRNFEKGEAAQRDIESTTGRQGIVEVWRVDLNSYKSVKAFCKRTEELDRLDIVVENAGIAVPKYVEIEKMESTIQTNVIATFYMVMMLLPVLRKSAERHQIVPVLSIVASDAHFQVNIPSPCLQLSLFLKTWQAVFDERLEPDIFKALNSPKNQSDRYNTSKLLEIFVVRELAPAISESRKPKIILNCLNPGLCESNLMQHASIPLSIAARVGKILIGRTTEVGSRTLFSGGTAGEESHGKYMSDCKVGEPSAFVRSVEGREAQERVWKELSVILEDIEPGITGNI